jgi:hypothetical protein
MNTRNGTALHTARHRRAGHGSARVGVCGGMDAASQQNPTKRNESRHPWASAHGSPRRTPHPPHPPQASTGPHRRAGHGSARVPRHGCRHAAKTESDANNRHTRGLPPTARHVAHHTHHKPPPHRPTQASRARKCPGAPAWMPTRKNRIRRYDTRHPWASAHGSPRHTPHPPQAPPQAHTGEPGTEVPGCPGTEADTLQKQNQTQTIATPVGFRPRLATSHTTPTTSPPTGPHRRAGHGSARVPRHGCRHAKTESDATTRDTRGLTPTARHVAHHAQPRVFTQHHTPPHPRHSSHTTHHTHLPHSAGISRSRDCTPNSHHPSIATLRTLSTTTQQSP